MHWLLELSPIFPTFVKALFGSAWYVALTTLVYAVAFALYASGQSVHDPVVREFYQSGFARFVYATAARSLAVAITVEFLFGKLLWKCCVALPAQIVGVFLSWLFAHSKATQIVFFSYFPHHAKPFAPRFVKPFHHRVLPLRPGITIVDVAFCIGALTYCVAQLAVAATTCRSVEASKRNSRFYRVFLIVAWTLVVPNLDSLPYLLVHFLIFATVIAL